MKRKFIFATSPVTNQQSKQISDLFQDKYGWWHWIDGFWLVTDQTETLSCSSIRDQLNLIVPKSRKMVLEITEGIWAGYGPSSPKSDMFKWINETWSGDS